MGALPALCFSQDHPMGALELDGMRVWRAHVPGPPGVLTYLPTLSLKDSLKGQLCLSYLCLGSHPGLLVAQLEEPVCMQETWV